MKRVRLAGVRGGLLQTFRLSHAVAEIGVPLAVDASRADAWRLVDRYFDGLDWRVTRRARDFGDVVVDHKLPVTRVGEIERPLIFAHGVLDRCRTMWADRSYLMTFSGLMSEARERSLSPLVNALGDELHVVATDAGRTWPIKAWDDDYYVTLGRSQMTACPNGDFIWTYRFFEAVMCGSIPVVEDGCEHYEGFRFYTMADRPAGMRWRSDWAIHNAELVRERVTVPSGLLLAAIRS